MLDPKITVSLHHRLGLLPACLLTTRTTCWSGRQSSTATAGYPPCRNRVMVHLASPFRHGLRVPSSCLCTAPDSARPPTARSCALRIRNDGRTAGRASRGASNLLSNSGGYASASPNYCSSFVFMSFVLTALLSFIKNYVRPGRLLRAVPTFCVFGPLLKGRQTLKVLHVKTF